MKFVKECLIFSTVLLIATSSIANAETTCFNRISADCDGEPVAQGTPASCNTQFGQFPRLINSTESLIREHLKASMQFLTLASHFGEWNINRKGFQDYFNKLSDSSWADGVALMLHLVERGGSLSPQFGIPYDDEDDDDIGKGLSELGALGKALDIEKRIAKKTLLLIVESNHGPAFNDTTDVADWNKFGYQRDGEFSHFLANQVSDKQAVRVKNLSNHVNTLSQALKETSDPGLVLYIYDTQIIPE